MTGQPDVDLEGLARRLSAARLDDLVLPAMLAAGAGSPVTMETIGTAVRAEYRKLGLPFRDDLFNVAGDV